MPDLACEVAMGPIRDFDFDAAILFSDLLFPLEALGMSLSYDEGPPKLDGPLTASASPAFRPLAEALPHGCGSRPTPWRRRAACCRPTRD